MVKQTGSLLKVKYIELLKCATEQRKTKMNVDDFNIIYILILLKIGINNRHKFKEEEEENDQSDNTFSQSSSPIDSQHETHDYKG